ncbi:hypothetical protein [Paenibacillus silagei]|uniref:Uncharacterized protein n=1 Tax=Paenibacillus silagei TaxID=1670801 RepID=A0ABS4P0H3_9BACL|nr:hypothetical protein [Paenibacillus silagei]MBP2115802.1 hypothetical protein [Paenibacillus silagei]
MFKKILKISVTAALLVSVSPVNAFATERVSNEFDYYRSDVINQELLQKGYSALDYARSSLPKTIDNITSQHIKELQNAEIVIMNFDEQGALSTAESSESGEATKRFVKEIRENVIDEQELQIESEGAAGNKGIVGETSLATSSNISIQSVLPNSPSAPPGADTGAFHRLKTPASNSTLNYSGAVADDVRLPGFAVANTDGEAGYLYTGIDQGEVGIGEVGFGTYSGSGGQGWFPLFHARATHTVTTQPGSVGNNAEYYYDYAKNYGTGNVTITGYKVYYKTTDSILTVTYQIGYNTIYVVKFNGYNSANKSVKRVTAIAMPSGTSGKFKNGYSSYANWGNYRFLTQNGSDIAYPGNVSGLVEHVWNHGGVIDYIKTIINNDDRDEQYRIY